MGHGGQRGGELLLFDLEHRYKLDAAGRHVESVEMGLSITQGFDGDGRIVRRTEVYAAPAATLDTYSICSTALGGRVVAEVEGNGTRKRAFIYAAGEEVARVEGSALNWEHRHPATGGRWVSHPNATSAMVTELDPLGANVGGQSAYADLTPAEMMFVNQNAHYESRAGDPSNLHSECSVNGLELPCDIFLRLADDGVLALRANNPLGPGSVERPLQGLGGDGRHFHLSRPSRTPHRGVLYWNVQTPRHAAPPTDISFDRRAAFHLDFQVLTHSGALNRPCSHKSPGDSLTSG